LTVAPVLSARASVGASACIAGRVWAARAVVVITLVAQALIAAPGAAAPNTKHAVMALDVHTGRILHDEHGEAPRYPASLTKMMTLYMVFDAIERGRLSYGTKIRMSRTAASRQPSKLGLKPGETIAVRDAVAALIVKSANDVAAAIGEHIAGSEPAFGRLMTRRARKIGMTRTTFRNASGLPNRAQKTTARDMLTLALRLQRDFPEHYKNFSRRTFTWGGRTYRNYNRLLGRFKGVDGIKTGYTRASGFNLVSSVKRNGRHVVAAVFGGRSGRTRNALMTRVLVAALKKASPAPKRPTRPLLVARPRVIGRGRQVANAAAAPAIVAPRPRAAVPASITELIHRTHSERTRRKAERQALRTGGAHIQVGAYRTVEEAQRQAAQVRARAQDLLAAHAAIAQPVTVGNRRLYRARFAGFDRASARATCAQLKSTGVDCYVAN